MAEKFAIKCWNVVVSPYQRWHMMVLSGLISLYIAIKLQTIRASHIKLHLINSYGSAEIAHTHRISICTVQYIGTQWLSTLWALVACREWWCHDMEAPPTLPVLCKWKPLPASIFVFFVASPKIPWRRYDIGLMLIQMQRWHWAFYILIPNIHAWYTKYIINFP